MTAPFTTRRAVLSSSGAGDAGAFPLLGANGLLDPSFIAAQSSYRAGRDSAPIPGVGSRFQTFKAVTYSTPFPPGAQPSIQITPLYGPFAGGNGVSGYGVDYWIQSGSDDETGFTVVFNSNHGESNPDGDINAVIFFSYLAIVQA